MKNLTNLSNNFQRAITCVVYSVLLFATLFSASFVFAKADDPDCEEWYSESPDSGCKKCKPGYIVHGGNMGRCTKPDNCVATDGLSCTACKTGYMLAESNCTLKPQNCKDFELVCANCVNCGCMAECKRCKFGYTLENGECTKKGSSGFVLEKF